MPKKTKLIIFPGNFLPHIGGLETHVDEFSKYLSKNTSYDITIFTPDILNSKQKEKIHKNVKIIRYPAFELVPNYPVAKFWKIDFYNLLFEIYTNKYDIVMTRTRFFKNSFLGLIFAKLRLNPLKLIHVEHGSSYVLLESKLKTKLAYIYDRIIGKLIFKFADKIVAISEITYQFIRKEFEKNREITIIKRGVDFELYKTPKKDKIIKTQFKDRIVMTFVGRLYKWKGVSQSIKAYKSLPENLQKKSSLIIIGSGEDLKRLEKLAGDYLDKGIHFFGKVEFDRAINILHSSDIYIHSSHPGGALSNSLLQAMICKCAIIASPNEGAKEVVINEQNGILLKDNKVDSIRVAMIKLINSKELRDRYSKEANKYILKNFGWNSVIEKYDKIMRGED